MRYKNRTLSKKSPEKAIPPPREVRTAGESAASVLAEDLKSEGRPNGS
jgi:hypothetical protein